MRRAAVLSLLLLATTAFAQSPADVSVAQLPFVRYSANRLHFDTASSTLNRFFDRWEQVVAAKRGNINIVHIGGSHIQAGTLPNAIRTNILAAYPNLVAGRGLIFPYSAAPRCNNPPDYRVRCPQPMTLTRNIYKEHSVPLGLAGIAVTAANQPTEVRIILTDQRVNYSTNRLVLLGHSDQGVMPRIRLADTEVYPSFIDGPTDRYYYNLPVSVDSFTVVLPLREGQKFAITGLLLDNDRPGISYHSIGVNGASVPDYLRCAHFSRDLRLLQPDLVIFGIGINDAVPEYFDTVAFRRNYLALVDSIRAVNPNCAFIFITNNDSYRKISRRKYAVNTNGALAREVFYRLAREVGGAVWDQFEVMGGLRSMDQWHLASLAQADRVHFTRDGYVLIGNLFTNAFFDALRRHRTTHHQPTTDARRITLPD